MLRPKDSATAERASRGESSSTRRSGRGKGSAGSGLASCEQKSTLASPTMMLRQPLALLARLLKSATLGHHASRCPPCQPKTQRSLLPLPRSPASSHRPARPSHLQLAHRAKPWRHKSPSQETRFLDSAERTQNCPCRARSDPLFPVDLAHVQHDEAPLHTTRGFPHSRQAIGSSTTLPHVDCSNPKFRCFMQDRETPSGSRTLIPPRIIPAITSLR